MFFLFANYTEIIFIRLTPEYKLVRINKAKNLRNAIPKGESGLLSFSPSISFTLYLFYSLSLLLSISYSFTYSLSYSSSFPLFGFPSISQYFSFFFFDLNFCFFFCSFIVLFIVSVFSSPFLSETNMKTNLNSHRHHKL